jgi:hypothetical protein
MGSWYTIGIVVGIGVALGVAATGALRRALLGAVFGAVVAGAIGLVVWHWGQAVGGVAGSPARSGAAGRGVAPRRCSLSARSSSLLSRSSRSSAISRRSPCPRSRRDSAGALPTRTRASARSPATDE